MNLAYTILLNHQPVVDIFTIAIGFVLRVYAGAMALDVPVSSWMFITTLCLALYSAAVKQRRAQPKWYRGRKVLEKILRLTGRSLRGDVGVGIDDVLQHVRDISQAQVGRRDSLGVSAIPLLVRGGDP